MPRTAKPKPLTAFEENLADAKSLLTYSRLLTTRRSREMRKELRKRIGEALRIPVGQRTHLDCIDNEQAFIVFRDSRQLKRRHVEDVRPLLRQAIVAACAAMETYLADKVTDQIGSVLKSDSPPRRMLDIPLTVGDYLAIDGKYERRGWGLRAVVEAAIRQQASTAPNQVGAVLGIIRIKDWSKKVDKTRGCQPGTTVEQLDVITKRRNQIAHSADRSGSGRATLSIDQTSTYLSQIEQITHALEKVIDSPR
jgi:hypothetical protein